ncbi:MAG: hypothetical protein ACRYGK_19085, partial [Janthinobacterium lividum]
MRSTRASAAIERLKTRSGNPDFSMVRTADGRFFLVATGADGVQEKLGEPLEMDEFVRFVNAHGPQVVKRVSKLDVKF